mmetsp:Transcript_29560/g.96260  ORF Transcript_29560/g.96260 Transcript_29560/m.96260 type:complete len:183 (-) Transcript_29560:451-999(-)
MKKTDPSKLADARTTAQEWNIKLTSPIGIDTTPVGYTPAAEPAPAPETAPSSSAPALAPAPAEAVKLSAEEEAALRRAFDLFDSDKSGAIDAGELERALRALRKKVTKEQAAELVAKHDADGSGQIEFHEFAALAQGLEGMHLGEIIAADFEQFGENLEQFGKDIETALNLKEVDSFFKKLF